MMSFNTETNSTWQRWATHLNAWNIQELSADLLEVSGPFNLIAAQLVYLSQPLLSSLWKNDDLTALANLLEEPNNTNAFISFLREGHE